MPEGINPKPQDFLLGSTQGSVMQRQKTQKHHPPTKTPLAPLPFPQSRPPQVILKGQRSGRWHVVRGLPFQLMPANQQYCNAHSPRRGHISSAVSQRKYANEKGGVTGQQVKALAANPDYLNSVLSAPTQWKVRKGPKTVLWPPPTGCGTCMPLLHKYIKKIKRWIERK